MRKRGPDELVGFVIGGHPRSGTSILSEIFHSHPAIGITFEYKTYVRGQVDYSEHRRLLHSNFFKRPILPWHSPYISRPLSFWFDYRYKRNLSNYCRRDNQVDTTMITRALSDTFRRRVVGDKWPGYIYQLGKLTTFPGIDRIVIVYRDCRDVALSTLEKAGTDWKDTPFVAKLDTVEKVAHRWVKAIELMERHADAIHSVRYEELVTSPRKVMRGVGEYLGVDPDGFDIADAHPSSIGRYRQGLSGEQIQTVLDIAGPTMKTYDYT